MVHLRRKRNNQITGSMLLRSIGKLIAVLVFLACPSICWADDDRKAKEPSADFMELSLEELMNIEVTSVSKKPEKLSEAAAAIFVISNEKLDESTSFQGIVHDGNFGPCKHLPYW